MGGSAVTIGVDIGGTFVKLGLVQADTILLERSFPTAHFPGPTALVRKLALEVGLLLGKSPSPVRGVGVGIPGLVQYPEGIVRSVVNLKGGWRNVPFKGLLAKRLHLPVQVDNDVNLMTLAEWLAGAGKGVSHLVCLTLGTGVGGGIVLDGKLFRGASGSAGEIGHMPLSWEGPRCPCGGKACLERSVGSREVLRRVRGELRKGIKSRIPGLIDHRLDRLTPEVIDEACALGDSLAFKTWRRVGREIGLILVGVVNLLNPEKIVVGGGIAKAGEWVFQPMRQTLRRRAMRGLGNIPIVPATLGTSAGLLGAALLAQGRGGQ